MSVELRAYARSAAARAGFPPDVFEAQIQQESGFDPAARSPAGALGIAQIVPAAHPGVNPWDPYASLDYAARWMAALHRQFGRLDLALAAYNAGPGAVQRYGGVPPFAETQRYVAVVLANSGARADSAPGASLIQTPLGAVEPQQVRAGLLLAAAAAALYLLSS